jgi:hypothetical protein
MFRLQTKIGGKILHILCYVMDVPLFSPIYHLCGFIEGGGLHTKLNFNRNVYIHRAHGRPVTDKKSHILAVL